MRIPQVTDRMRQAPVHALRAVFTGIGQVFMAADKLKEEAGQADAARAGSRDSAGRDGQTAGWSPLENQAAGARLSGPARSGKAAAAAAKAERVRRSGAAAAQAAAAEARWRSLDQTGNVRLLSAEELAAEFEEPPAPRGVVTPAPFPTPVQSAAPRTPVDAPAPLASPEPAAPKPSATIVFIDESLQEPPPPDEADEAPALDEEPTAAETTSPDLAVIRVADEAAAPVEVAELAETVGEADLPVPNYDALSLPSLRARLRNLDAAQLSTLVDYERAHAARPDFVTMFERRIEKLAAQQ